MTPSHHPKSRGFTLVELLVVIGIIGLLLSIMMPMLNNSKQFANSLQCQSNLRSVGQMLLMYSQDNRGIPFPVGGIASSGTAVGYPGGLGTNVPLMERWTIVCLNKLKPNPEVMICPLDREIGDEDTKDKFLITDTGDQLNPFLNKHSYILNKHLIYENIRFGRSNSGYFPNLIVLAGEKNTDYFDYYMECDVNKSTLALTTTDFFKVELTRHGVKYRSNTLYLDTHVDNKDPYKIIPGKYVGTTPVDSAFSDPWQVRTQAVPWPSPNAPTTLPNP